MNRLGVIDILLSLLALSLIVTGCLRAEVIPPPQNNPNEPTTTVVEPGAQQLRIKNTGTHDIQNLTVLFPASQIHFGDVPAGATTVYQTAPKGVYKYAAYQFTLNGETVTEPALDWIGESPLSGKSFTYVLDYDASRPRMEMVKLVEVLAE